MAKMSDNSVPAFEVAPLWLLSLTSVLGILKILGAVSWSWWWVIAPIWIPLASVVSFCLLCYALYALNLYLVGELFND